MSNLLDFKIRASASQSIMGGVKQPIDKYNDANAELERLRGLQEKAKNKETKTFLDREEKIKEQLGLVNELAKTKDRYELPTGAKTYVRSYLLDHVYGGVGLNKVTVKEMQKGHEVEADNIAYYGEQRGLVLEKNEAFYENEWAKGTPDVVTDDLVIDMKSSWDYTTFPIWAQEIPNKDYSSQLQVYMWLTERTRARLVYVLSNTPEGLCRSDLDMLDYSELLDDFRIKEFDIEYDDEFISKLQERSDRCQDYLNALIRQMNWQKYFEG